MSLLITDNIENGPYLVALTSELRPIIPPSGTAGSATTYLDRDDLIIGSLARHLGGQKMIWDPNLIDSTGSRVGKFTSPVANGTSGDPFFVGDYEPGTNDQRLFQTLGTSSRIRELNYTDPTQLDPIDDNPFQKFTRNQPDDFSSGQEFHWSHLTTAGQFIFFPGIDLAVTAQARLWTSGPALKDHMIVNVEISTGKGTPAGIVGKYSSGGNEFNRGPIFGETTVDMVTLQFLPDDSSTHARPRGEIFLCSAGRDNGPTEQRVYVQFVDFDPTGLGGLPNRVHLRQTLLSRIDLIRNTVPVGDPPVPLNAWIFLNSGGTQVVGNFFTTQGSRRMFFCHSNDTDPNGDSFMVTASKAAIPAFISSPSPKVQPVTNRLVTYQVEVTGSLDEDIANAVVTFSALRGSTVAELVDPLPGLGGTYTVDNVPIDRTIIFAAGFGVFKDAVEMTEGAGAGEYTVDEALGEITFGAAEPVVGPIYTVRYAHPAAGATPAHGTVIDSSVFTSILGIGTTRVQYPDTPALDGHIDLVTASTPT